MANGLTLGGNGLLPGSTSGSKRPNTTGTGHYTNDAYADVWKGGNWQPKGDPSSQMMHPGGSASFDESAGGTFFPLGAPGGGKWANASPAQKNSALETYWENNPGALNSAIASNPNAFTPTNNIPGHQPNAGIADFINKNPDALEQYWADNPSELAKAVEFNPDKFGIGTGDRYGSYSVPITESYDDYIDRYFEGAMRTISPYIDQQNSRFDQAMINKGLSPDSEAFNTAYDQKMRSHNDLLNDAVFEAMGFGADRLDADRQYGLSRDAFDYQTMDTDRRFDLSEL